MPETSQRRRRPRGARARTTAGAPTTADDAYRRMRATARARDARTGPSSVEMRRRESKKVSSAREQWPRRARSRVRALASGSWTFDDARKTATTPDGARVAYVSRPDVKFIYDEIFGRGCYDFDDASSARGGSVIDVGANIGLASARFASLVGEGGRVIALEPVPATFRALARNCESLCGAASAPRDEEAVELVGARERSVAVGGGAKGSGCGVVYAHNVGVGSTRGEFTIDFFPRAAGWSTSSKTRDDAETIENVIEYAFEALKPGANDDGYDGLEHNAVTSVGRFVRAFVLDPERAASAGFLRRLASVVAAFILRIVVRCVAAYMLTGVERITRPIVTVSDVIDAHGLDSVSMLKIDVERAELDVLTGVSDAHWPRIHRVNLECHDSLDRVLDLLRHRAGFDVVRVDRLFGAARLYNIAARRSP